ncbi:MAG: prolyl oligopeptidase family serine peptidase [Limisphaerales bacterium]
MQRRFSALFWAALTVPLSILADGPKDNVPDKVRPIPPVGIEIDKDAKNELLAGAVKLGSEILQLRETYRAKPEFSELLPDIEIYQKAVEWAVRYRQIYRQGDINAARDLLKRGQERAAQLHEGKAPWLSATGLVVRGYRSSIDGSVQPYGLVIPRGFVPGGAPMRLDFWFHGRGERLSELSFINQRQRTVGHFAPPNTIVLHPYGRYSNANKFAGEMDLFEALEHAKKHYPIDEDRIAVRGFSMGGAACWQFAVHYPGKWFAATPGAGFSETPEFLKFFQDEALKPTRWERKLWRLYDCTGYAGNLYNLPTIAYSGENDRQKQAADIMATALQKEGLTLTHLIGPGMGHKYDDSSKVEIERRMSLLSTRGRDRLPLKVKFTTYTLRYNQSHWVRINGIKQHWERAHVEAEIIPARHRVKVLTEGVTALTLSIPSGHAPFPQDRATTIEIDGTSLRSPKVETDRSWTAHLSKTDGPWEITASSQTSDLAKRHGLQGPIDDAFMSSFLFVRPTGKSKNSKFHQWADSEMKRAQKHWPLQFRGIARIKADKEVTKEDIAHHNLILWGDADSNQLLAKVGDKLPIQWRPDEITVGPSKYNSANHALIAVYPNPLNPEKYIVLNSGFTYREYAYLNNARQVPMLPDWAIIDLKTPPGTQYPGRVADAGFFNESWKLY